MADLLDRLFHDIDDRLQIAVSSLSGGSGGRTLILCNTFAEVLQRPQPEENTVISEDKRSDDEICHQGDKGHPFPGKEGQGRGLQSETDRSRYPALFEDRLGELICTGVLAKQLVLLGCRGRIAKSGSDNQRRDPRGDVAGGQGKDWFSLQVMYEEVKESFSRYIFADGSHHQFAVILFEILDMIERHETYHVGALVLEGIFLAPCFIPDQKAGHDEHAHKQENDQRQPRTWNFHINLPKSFPGISYPPLPVVGHYRYDHFRHVRDETLGQTGSYLFKRDKQRYTDHSAPYRFLTHVSLDQPSKK